MNTGGRLQTLVYGQAAAVHVDPIEKKPVYHLLPGTKTFSIATVGCNLRCTFCQNWTLSQEYPERVAGTPLAPADVVAHALVQGCRSIAYTYSEPVVFFEYVIDTAQAARTAGLKNILVSAGYINPEPLDELLALCDCVKIDLKGFQGSFYRDYVSGDVRHVLRTLQAVRTHGVLLEVVNLVVPTLNDSPGDLRALARWVRSELGSDTPLFFSRFSPHYRLTNLSPTPRETLDLAYTIAKEEDLRYVYVGNVPGHPGENTVCPGCGKIIIGRYGYFVTRYALKGSRCFYCGMTIPGSWDETTAQMTRPWIRTQSEVLAQ